MNRHDATGREGEAKTGREGERERWKVGGGKRNGLNDVITVTMALRNSKLNTIWERNWRRERFPKDSKRSYGEGRNFKIRRGHADFDYIQIIVQSSVLRKHCPKPRAELVRSGEFMKLERSRKEKQEIKKHEER